MRLIAQLPKISPCGSSALIAANVGLFLLVETPQEPIDVAAADPSHFDKLYHGPLAYCQQF